MGKASLPASAGSHSRSLGEARNRHRSTTLGAGAARQLAADCLGLINGVLTVERRQAEDPGLARRAYIGHPGSRPASTNCNRPSPAEVYLRRLGASAGSQRLSLGWLHDVQPGGTGPTRLKVMVPCWPILLP